MKRRRPIGAEPTREGTHFRVWAPAHDRVDIIVDDREVPMQREPRGYFSALADVSAGALYRYRINDELYPDPASRFQPDGPHGPSQVVDPAFEWTDANWRGPEERPVLYEMHFGTFTPEGTYTAAIEQLDALADLGVTVLEVMPVNEFPGTFGWGYDGVDIWAPTRLYGTPDDFRRFVDAAHARGLAVVLDVVYNHLGPDGCYLSKFTPAYFTDKYKNEWGDPLNFDGEESHGVREFFRENAAYWIDEFHLDGMRLDATQSLFDDSATHIIREIVEACRAAAGDRRVLMVAENEPQDRKLLTEYGLDTMWNDDWHHAARVALTGRNEAYYSDYTGRPQELISMARLGFLYQGQRYKWQKKRRGTPSFDLEPRSLVCYLQNHDQIANSATGARLQTLTSPGRLRAMTALLLLQPQTPMLFQGQEFAASAPFLYFADHTEKLAQSVAEGRRDFVSQFPSVKAAQELLRLPHERATFESCKLDHAEREQHAEAFRLHRDLLRMRREWPHDARLEGAVLGEECLALRWLAEDDRLLIVNLGRALHLDPAPEPLLAPPSGAERWKLAWSTEAPEYGGTGTPELDTEENWRIPAQAAVVLTRG
ncbi:MAG TPA: malto-oligosyltrehalose trehalohydrolase [Thermoanaerobaculia bacterium]